MVGAGVASPEVTPPAPPPGPVPPLLLTKLSEDNDIGMSIAMSGSDGAENRSEKPAADLPAVVEPDGESDAGGGGLCADDVLLMFLLFSSVQSRIKWFHYGDRDDNSI